MTHSPINEKERVTHSPITAKQAVTHNPITAKERVTHSPITASKRVTHSSINKKGLTHSPSSKERMAITFPRSSGGVAPITTSTAKASPPLSSVSDPSLIRNSEDQAVTTANRVALSVTTTNGRSSTSFSNNDSFSVAHTITSSNSDSFSDSPAFITSNNWKPISNSDSLAFTIASSDKKFIRNSDTDNTPICGSQAYSSSAATFVMPAEEQCSHTCHRTHDTPQRGADLTYIVPGSEKSSHGNHQETNMTLPRDVTYILPLDNKHSCMETNVTFVKGADGTCVMPTNKYLHESPLGEM